VRLRPDVTYHPMNTTKNLLATLVAILILSASAAGLWLGGAYLVRLAGSSDWLATPDPMLFLCLALLFSAFAVSSSLRWTKRRDRELQTREARRGVYESAMLAWQDALRAAREQGGTISSRLPQDIHALEVVLASRASSTVLRHYVQLRQLCSQSDTSPEQVQDQLFALILEVRRELGVSGFGTDERSALRSFLMNPRTEIQPESQPTAFSDRRPTPVVTPARPVFSLRK